MALSRKEVLEQYEVDERGVIRSPGKMEANPLWVPALWDQTMESGEDETVYDGDTPISVFYISAEDTKEFPELKKYKVVTLYEDDQGFVQWNGYKTEVDYNKDAEEITRDSMEAEGPAEGDLVTEDHKTFWEHGMSRRRPAVTVDIDASTEEMWAAIDEWMEKQQFYPNVWFISDHGNVSLMTRKRR